MKLLEGRAYIFLLKVIHEHICIGWCSYRIHGTAVYFKRVFDRYLNTKLFKPKIRAKNDFITFAAHFYW